LHGDELTAIRLRIAYVRRLAGDFGLHSGYCKGILTACDIIEGSEDPVENTPEEGVDICP